MHVIVHYCFDTIIWNSYFTIAYEIEVFLNSLKNNYRFSPIYKRIWLKQSISSLHLRPGLKCHILLFWLISDVKLQFGASFSLLFENMDRPGAHLFLYCMCCRSKKLYSIYRDFMLKIPSTRAASSVQLHNYAIVP